MADRYSENNSYGRDGRSGRSRWNDQDMERGRMSRSRRSEDFDDDDYRFNRDDDDDRQGYGYGGSASQNMSGGQYGGGYGPREDWDQEDRGDRDRMRYGQGYESGGQNYREQRRSGGRGGQFGQGQYRQSSYGRSGYGQSGQYGSGDSQSDFSRQGYGADDNWNRGSGQGYAAEGNQNYGRSSQAPSNQRGSWGTGEYGQSGMWGDQPGRFRGRGPKNYTRSDDRIRDDINDRLTDDHHIDASEIEVKVSNCDVILSGMVDSRQAKRHAEDLVEAVSGVKNVQNNLRVQSGDESSDTSRSGRTGKGGQSNADNKSDKLQ